LKEGRKKVRGSGGVGNRKAVGGFKGGKLGNRFTWGRKSFDRKKRESRYPGET